MNRLNYCILVFGILLVSQAAFTQNTSLKVKSLEIADYRYNSMYSDVKNKADINSLYKITKDGKVTVQLAEEEGFSYCSFNLPVTVIQEVNKLFDGKKKLGTNYAAGMPEQGVKYGAQKYNFIRVTNLNNTSESACYLDEFMTDTFTGLIAEIRNLVLDYKQSPSGTKIITPLLIKNITDQHKKTKVLDVNGGPPPEEIITDPSKSGPPPSGH